MFAGNLEGCNAFLNGLSIAQRCDLLNAEPGLVRTLILFYTFVCELLLHLATDEGIWISNHPVVSQFVPFLRDLPLAPGVLPHLPGVTLGVVGGCDLDAERFASFTLVDDIRFAFIVTETLERQLYTKRLQQFIADCPFVLPFQSSGEFLFARDRFPLFELSDDSFPHTCPMIGTPHRTSYARAVEDGGARLRASAIVH